MLLCGAYVGLLQVERKTTLMSRVASEDDAALVLELQNTIRYLVYTHALLAQHHKNTVHIYQRMYAGVKQAYDMYVLSSIQYISACRY